MPSTAPQQKKEESRATRPPSRLLKIAKRNRSAWFSDLMLTVGLTASQMLVLALI